MKIFIYCTYNDLFFTGEGFTNDFMNCMFFSGASFALAQLNHFLDANKDFDISDFDLYVKCEVY